ncbi:MAG: hypothetical protein ACRDYA_13555 [Egibacteraceae bacterium]
MTRQLTVDFNEEIDDVESRQPAFDQDAMSPAAGGAGSRSSGSICVHDRWLFGRSGPAQRAGASSGSRMLGDGRDSGWSLGRDDLVTSGTPSWSKAHADSMGRAGL